MNKLARFSLKPAAFKLPEAAAKQTLISLGISLLIVVVSIAFCIVAQPVLPIFYSLARANQQLVPKEWLVIFPSLSLGIILTHVIILTRIKEYEEILLKLFGLYSIIIQLLFLIALVRILFITW